MSRLFRASAADHAARLPQYLAVFREDAIATPPEALAAVMAANLAQMLADPRAAH